MRPDPAPDPARDPATTTDPVDHSRLARTILWLKVVAATVETAAGLALLAFGIASINFGSFIRHLALHELQQDPDNFLARHLIVGLPALTRLREIIVGGTLTLYGALKGGVVLAVLRRHHRVAIFGSVLFIIVALGAAFVLLLHPNVVRAVLGLLDLAVAVVMVREALSLRR